MCIPNAKSSKALCSFNPFGFWRTTRNVSVGSILFRVWPQHWCVGHNWLIDLGIVWCSLNCGVLNLIFDSYSSMLDFLRGVLEDMDGVDLTLIVVVESIVVWVNGTSIMGLLAGLFISLRNEVIKGCLGHTSCLLVDGKNWFRDLAGILLLVLFTFFAARLWRDLAKGL